MHRAETKALIGGGGVYSYIRVLPDEFLLKSVVITVDFKRNSSGRTRIYEYAPPPPPNKRFSFGPAHAYVRNTVYIIFGIHIYSLRSPHCIFVSISYWKNLHELDQLLLDFLVCLR